jgi:glycine cleavage system H protein
VTGEVVAANGEIESSPERLNHDPYAAWMFKIKPDNPADLNALLDAAAYQQLVESEAH